MQDVIVSFQVENDTIWALTNSGKIVRKYSNQQKWEDVIESPPLALKDIFKKSKRKSIFDLKPTKE